MAKLYIYTHPAVPPSEFKVGIKYTLEELEKKFTAEEIDCFFKPLFDEKQKNIKNNIKEK